MSLAIAAEAPDAPSMEPSPGAAPGAWTPLARVAFRFTFAYLGLYSLGEITMLFEQDAISRGDRAWAPLVRWFGAHALGIKTPLEADIGSGDTTFVYVRILSTALFAVAATVVWSALDRNRPRYDRLLAGLRVWLRYFLLCTMLSYGLIKIIPLQFSAPGPGRLMEPFGRASPMGLLWTFMGASGPYTRFAGFSELLGGALILFRRTALAGALVVLAVMSNVLMLNLCYDVPVKVFAAHVVLMAGLLVALDARRLGALLGRAVDATPSPAPLFSSRRAQRIASGVWIVAVLWAIGYQASETHKYERVVYGRTPSPLEGAWRIERLVKDGAPTTLLATDDTTWRRLVISQYSVSVQLMDDSMRRYPLKVAPGDGRLADQFGSALDATRPDAAHLILDGKLVDPETKQAATVRLELARIDPSTWLLTNRGFHFINEFPLNR